MHLKVYGMRDDKFVTLNIFSHFFLFNFIR